MSKRDDLLTQIKDLNASASIHSERLGRSQELLASCDREIKQARTRLGDALDRKTSMELAIQEAPGRIDAINKRIAVIRQEIKQFDAQAQIEKATEMAKQIAALQAAGFTVTPPEAK